MSRDVYFLCGHFERKNFIYAVKFNEGKWHYFEEKDAFLNVHVTLETYLDNRIEQLINKVKPLFMSLSEEQFDTYIKDEKFVFKGIELKTYTQLQGQQEKQDRQPPRKCKSKSSSDDLVFKAGQTNPANFLYDFEKCIDVKSDKDKLFKIRNFVSQEDKPEFSTLYFDGDWETARNKFLKKYSYAFTENKKRELSCAFDGETSLREFVIRKLDSLSTYTSLSFKNQLEMILSDLPNEISNLFIIKDKMSCSKSVIIQFCDSIQEFVDGVNNARSGSTTPIASSEKEILVVQEMEIVSFQSDIGSEVESLSELSSSSNTRRKVRAKPSLGRGRPPKKMKSGHMCEESETGESDTTTKSSASSNF